MSNAQELLPDTISQKTVVARCFFLIEEIRNKINIALLRIEWYNIGKGVTIEKWAVLKWQIHIGEGTVILSSARLEDSIVGKNCEIGWEVKRSSLGDGIKAKHRCVILNADVGSYSNIAAGVVFANYNGVEKGCFELWEWSFIGANSTVVFKSAAEKRILGEWSLIPANAVIECDIPAFWRFIPSNAHNDTKIDDLSVHGWYVRLQSGINIARQKKIHW